MPRHLTVQDYVNYCGSDFVPTITDCGSLTTTSNTGDYTTGGDYYGDPYGYLPNARALLADPAIKISGALDLNGMDVEKEINKLNKFKNEKEKEDMMYLWEVILVDPKTDLYEIFEVTAKSETSALMEAYMLSQTEEDSELNNVEFDDLKTSCKVLFEWKKEKDLKKAIETIKDAVK